MNAETCLKKLQYIGVLAFATVDGQGYPQVRNISAIHYEPDSLYFFTAKGKAFCRELIKSRHVQILGYTKYKEMIRLSADAEPVREEEQQKWTDIIFEEQPYLYNIYPDDTRLMGGMVFRISEGEIEYFNLGVNPIFREKYAMGGRKSLFRGYYGITDKCTGCGKCVVSCPQHCIEKGKPAVINSIHCLSCGICFDICPVKAIERLD